MVKTIWQKLKAERQTDTQTLWNNEVSANIFLAKTMLATALLALIFILLSLFNIIWCNNTTLLFLCIAIFVLVFPAVICFIYKGDKEWLKSVLLFFYCIVFAMIQAVFGHNVVLCFVFPVVLSVRYYSKYVTASTAFLTLLFSGVSEYIGVALGYGRLDLNMTELPSGTVLTIPDSMLLRDAVDIMLIDRNRLWLHTLQNSFLPKIIIFILLSNICVVIAGKGRKAILEQKKETEKLERLSTELNLASEIQNNVLPNIFPVFPDRKEFDLYASMKTAKEVGGDFYDFFFIDDDHIGLVMADVSGKGIGAALFMMVSRTLIKTRSQVGGTPSEILYDVNNQLCEGNKAHLFVTVWLGILEISTGRLITANAGHEHPAIRKKDGTYVLDVYKHSPICGAISGLKYKEHEFVLDPGDILFVYTDGVPEANNSDNKLLGTDRMLEILNRDPGAAPDKVLTNVMDGINEFVAGAEQFDDITMLCIRYNGN